MTRLELANGSIVVGRVIEVMPDALHLVGPNLNRKVAIADLSPETVTELGLARTESAAAAVPALPQGLELTRTRMLEGEAFLRESAALYLIPLQTQVNYFGGGGYAIEPIWCGYGYRYESWPCGVGTPFSAPCYSGSSFKINIKF